MTPEQIKQGIERVLALKSAQTHGDEWTQEHNRIIFQQKADYMADLLAAVLPMLDALDEVRDAVLHGRGPLEAVLDNDQTNAVLSVIDTAIDAAARKQENT